MVMTLGNPVLRSYCASTFAISQAEAARRLLRRGPVLAALVAGEAAEAFERQPAAASVERVMAVLRRIYEPQGIQVPAPVQVPPCTCRCLFCRT